MDYLVSVIIPVFNRVKYVERAVMSIINQKNSDCFKIILVDDGSSDGSESVCDELQNKFANVFVFHQKNAGVSAARNKGIENAEGKWISFIDCDDYVYDGFYEMLSDREEADLLCCDFDFHGGNFPLIGDRINEGIYYKKDFAEVLYPLMTESYVFYSACNKIFRKDIIDNNNLRFVVGMKLAEDMTFVYEYVKYINSFRFVNQRLYYYEINENSVTNIVKKSFETTKSTYLYHSDYFKEIDADGKISEHIQLVFLMNSVDSISVAAKTLSMREAVSYIKSIINDEVFYKNYEERNVCYYAKGIDKLLDKRILKKQALLICMLVKLNNFRIKLMSK